MKKEEGTLEITIISHNMPTYIEALCNGAVNCTKEYSPISEAVDNVEEADSDFQYLGFEDFSIEGKRKSVGEYGFGQA